jgi:hypothetical protein
VRIMTGIVLANAPLIINLLEDPPRGIRQPNWRWLQVRGFPGPVLRRWVVFFQA